MNLDEILISLQKIRLFKPEEEMALITDEPKIPGYLCFPNEEASKKYDTEDSFGQGFDLDRKKARIKAIGEFLERLSMYNPQKEKFIFSTYQTNEKFIDPALFCCYSEEQTLNKKDFIEKLRNENYHWWPVTDLTSNEQVLVPAQMVFLSHLFDEEFPIRQERISTGAALGPLDTNHALKVGLMEVVERDACISSYLTRRNISKIANFPESINKLISYFERYQLEPHVFDVTTDLNIPTVLAVTIDHTGIGASVNVGSRSALDYENAIKYALLESIHCRRTSRILKQFQFPSELPNENEITSLDNRFYYWHSLDRIKDLDFWLDTSNIVSYNQLVKKNTSLKKAIESLKNKKYHVLVAEMTLPEIKSEGFESLKILIPELHPLYLDERAKALYSIHHGTIKDDKILKPHPLT